MGAARTLPVEKRDVFLQACCLPHGGHLETYRSSFALLMIGFPGERLAFGLVEVSVLLKAFP